MPDSIRKYSFPVGETDTVLAMLNRHPAGKDAGFDMHYELEFGVVLKGTVLRKYQNCTMQRTVGEMWFCGIWEPHASSSVTESEVLTIVLWPPMVAAMRYAELKGGNPLAPFQVEPKSRPVRVPQHSMPAVRSLIALAGSNSPWDATRRRLLISNLFLDVRETMANMDAVVPDNDFGQISRAVELAFEADTFVSNEIAARACSMAAPTFIRTFKLLMGVSFSKFSLRQRLSRAAVKLRNSIDPVKAIAAQYGFTDVSHLHRQFQKHYSTTPTQYRRGSS